MKGSRYCLVQDDSSHWYLIFLHQKERFNFLSEQIEKDDEDYATQQVFDFEFGHCRCSGPHHLTFTDPVEE